MPRGSSKNLFLWVLQIPAGALFVLAGFGKLSGSENSIELFHTIGIGQWFRYLIGILELIGGLTLFTPSFSGAGAIILALVMLGAILLHILVIGYSPMMAIILLLVSAIIIWGRWERILQLTKTVRNKERNSI